jgi:hypothetical protein
MKALILSVFMPPNFFLIGAILAQIKSYIVIQSFDINKSKLINITYIVLYFRDVGVCTNQIAWIHSKNVSN